MKIFNISNNVCLSYNSYASACLIIILIVQLFLHFFYYYILIIPVHDIYVYRQ